MISVICRRTSEHTRSLQLRTRSGLTFCWVKRRQVTHTSLKMILTTAKCSFHCARQVYVRSCYGGATGFGGSVSLRSAKHLFSAIREDVCTLLSQVWQDISTKKKMGCRLVALRTFPTPELVLQLNSKTSSPTKSKIVVEVENFEAVQRMLNECCNSGIGQGWEYAFDQTYFVTKLISGCVFRRSMDRTWQCCVDPYTLSYQDMKSVAALLL